MYTADNGVQDLFVADRETHVRQKRLLSHAFSERALREQEDILTAHVSKLLKQLATRCTPQSLDLSAWYTFTSMFNYHAQ